MSEHDNDTCPHLVRASLLEAENARLKAEVERLHKYVETMERESMSDEYDINHQTRIINGLLTDKERLKAEVERLRASSFVTAVPVEEYEKLKAEVERLQGIILAQSSDFVRSKTADDGIKPEGHNDLAGRAVERCLKLQIENERLRKAGDAMASCITEFRCGKYGNALDKVGGFYVWQDWLKAKEGKQS